jgi:ATP-binding cassette, subfamily C (CFTR/MRP), member 1
MWIIQRFYLNTSSQLRAASIEAKAPLLTLFLETIQGLATLRAFGWQAHYSHRHVERMEESQKSIYLLYSVQVWLKFVMDLVVMGIAVLLVALSIRMKGSVSVELLGLALVKLVCRLSTQLSIACLLVN